MNQLQNWLVNIDKSYFERAQVTLESFAFEATSVVSNVYTLFLHKVCLLFGNVYEACLIAHFVVFIIATFVWFCAIKKLFRSVIASLLLTVCIFLPLGLVLAITLNPFVLWLLLFGIVCLCIISCIKWLLKSRANVQSLPDASLEQNTQNEPVVTVVNFDDEQPVVVPVKDEQPVIFIPKSMEIPKRTSKPKLDFAYEVAVSEMFYDIDPPPQDDFDFLP